MWVGSGLFLDRFSRLVNVQKVVCFDLLVERFLLDIECNAVNLLPRPRKNPTERSQTHRLDALGDSEIVPARDLLLVGIGVPWVHGQPHNLVVDLGEARFL